MAIDGRQDQRIASEGSLGTAPYLAKIVSHLDPQLQGGFEVTLIRNSGNEIADETQTYVVRYASPFYGTTAYEYMGKNVTFDDSQKSYGFWAMPPDVGVTGLVIFIEGNAAQGYWIACVPDKFINHMIPAIGGTKIYEADQDYEQGEHPLPVAEHNRKANELDKSLEIDKIPRAVHPIAKRFKLQGLIRDEFRGTTTSTGRRDLPNLVFGMSSPGPLDRKGKKSFVGNKQAPALVSVGRLGGSQFVMDDGDDRYFRDKPASEGPPVYTKGAGDTEIPYNEHFRFRTRTGHQILMHNSEDLIYIGNARGTTWIEMSSDGKIDIFATDSISVRTKQDFNFRADRDINLEAGRNINIKANKDMYTNVVGNNTSIIEGNHNAHIFGNSSLRIDKNQRIIVEGTFDSKVLGNFKQTVSSDYDLNINGHNWQTSGGSNETSASSIIESAGIIHMNGPAAATASQAIEPLAPQFLVEHELPDLEKPGAEELVVPVVSILRRMPTPEPFPQHENLDPLKYKSKEIDRDAEGRFSVLTTAAKPPPTASLAEPADEWKRYKKPSDTPF
jgi:hypothetical protein